MRIAALVKQIPKVEEMTLGADGRLIRDGVPLEMSAYCRRAVSKGVELAVNSGGALTVLTLGPPTADDVLREAVAWGLDRGARVDAVHLCDLAFAGSDTLATARALAAALRREGDVDLILVGRNSIDAETGQVGPELAELLHMPFVAGVKELTVDPSGALKLRCERDDGWQEVVVGLPAVLSVAERLCDPAKVPPEGRAKAPAELIRRVTAADLGPGPWGQAASATVVGPTRVVEHARMRRLLDGELLHAVQEAVQVLVDRDALAEAEEETVGQVPAVTPGERVIAVAIEPDRERHARELLGAAAGLAASVRGRVVALAGVSADPAVLSSYGADEVVSLADADDDETAAAAIRDWAAAGPDLWAVLAPGTLWGRAVAARTAARLGAGLTGDAVAIEVDGDRLIAWKPAFGGQLVAAISATSPVHLVTVRPGVLPLLSPRASGPVPIGSARRTSEARRVSFLAAGRDDDVDCLLGAHAVVGVGTGVRPEDYPALQPLLDVLGAQLGATRKVTDKGWLPHARQIGITGRAIAPRLYIAIGVQGKFNHVVGVRAAGTVLAVNPNPSAPIFDVADIGIVAEWQAVVPLLVDEVAARRPAVVAS